MAYHYLWPEASGAHAIHVLVHWIVNWLLGALALWLVAQIIPGIQVREFQAPRCSPPS